MLELIQKYVDGSSAVKLAAGLERLVRDGRCAPGSLLPPVRELAAALEVSPGTAASAYRVLKDRGVVAGDRRRGTRVLGEPKGREYAERPVQAGEHDLRVANPDPALLLDLKPLFRAIDTKPGAYGDVHLDPHFASRVRAHFTKDKVDAEHLFVAGGAIGALQRALRACLAPGDKVAVEDPGFNEHHALVAAVGCTAAPVEVDDEGLLPKALEAALRSGARAVLTTARCQSPTGAAVTAKRAAALRAVLAARPDVAVLVDDYGAFLTDAPFADPVGKQARWLVVRSFNKALAPDVRVAAAVGDAQTIGRMRQQQWLGEGWVSPFLQSVCAQALDERATLAHAVTVYAQRREALLEALAARGITAHGRSGLNVWIPVDDEATVVAGLAGQGFHVRAGARYRLRAGPAVRITTARLPPSLAPRLADAFAQLLGASAPAP
jgi:DNA-binding transcriptional MocR family regulator